MDAGTADVLDFAIRLFREPRRAREVRCQPLPSADFAFLIRCAAGDQYALNDVWARFKLDTVQIREMVAFYLTLALFPSDAPPQRVLGLDPANRDLGKAREHYRLLLTWLNRSSDDPLQSAYLRQVHQAWHDRRTLQSKRPVVTPALRSGRLWWWRRSWANGNMRILTVVGVVGVLGAALATVLIWRQEPLADATSSRQQTVRSEAASVSALTFRTQPQAGWNRVVAVPSIPVIAATSKTSRRVALTPNSVTERPVESTESRFAEAALPSEASFGPQPVIVPLALPATRLLVDLSRLPHPPAGQLLLGTSLPRPASGNLLAEGKEQRFSRGEGPSVSVLTAAQGSSLLRPVPMAVKLDPLRLNVDLSRLPHPPVDLRSEGLNPNELMMVTSRPVAVGVTMEVPMAVLDSVRLTADIEQPGVKMGMLLPAVLDRPSIPQPVKAVAVPRPIGAASDIGVLLTDFATAYQAGSTKQLMSLFDSQVRSSHGGYRRIREEYVQLFQNTLRRQLVFSTPSIALSRDGRQARVLVRYQARAAFRGATHSRQGVGVMQLSLLRGQRSWLIQEIYRDRGVLGQAD